MSAPALHGGTTAIEEFATAWQVPGGVIATADSTGGIDLLPFGFSDLERRLPTSTDLLYEIGSISKIATACSVLRLVEDGFLDLDTEAREVLPWLPVGLGASGVTVERLLQHAAGLPASIDAHPDDLAQLASAAPPPPHPGQRFHYSNVGFLVLGAIIAHLRHEPFPRVIAQEVLAPCGMSESISRVSVADRDRLAVGYWPSRADLPPTPGVPPVRAPFLEVAGADGNIAATAADLARFGRMLALGGSGELGPVLTPDSFAAMTGRLGPGGEPVLQLDAAPTIVSSRYGLGVNVEQVRDGTIEHPVLSHGGGMVGFASFLQVDTSTGSVTAVVTNANGDSPVAEAIARAVAAGDPALLDRLRPSRWASGDGEPDDPGPERTVRPRRLHDGMPGRFHDAAGTTLEVHPPSATGAVEVSLDGARRALHWGWGERCATGHPTLSAHGLLFDAGTWVSGSRVFRVVDDEPGSLAAAPTAADLTRCGRYRAYTPWCPELRILVRGETLRLVSFGGVESPGDDLPLVWLGGDVYAIGDAELPERLVFGPVVEGTSAWVDKDGCRYSRMR